MTNAAHTETRRPAHAPYADQPTYTSWRLTGKTEGYEHEVIFTIDKDGGRAAILHTFFGGTKSAGGGAYNKQQVFSCTREEAREQYRLYVSKGFRKN